MFDKDLLKDCLTKYKERFGERWKDERYKWEAAQWFQTHWDINAENFYQMFTDATDKTYNLLASMNNFPRGMIQVYSEQDPEAVRAMFINLFDESKDVSERVVKFQADAQELCDRLSPGKQHYQRPMAITVYLWLHNPDKYSIFRYTTCRAATQYLKSDFVPKKGNPIQNIKGNMDFIEGIRQEVNKDDGLIRLFNDARDDSCYADTDHRTLAFDVSFFIAHYIADAGKKETKEALEADIADGITDNDENQVSATTPYTREDFLSEVYMTAERYDTLRALLMKKKNLILQGAPGVGKTFAAKRLAYSIMGCKDEDRIEFIQFHQNYSYEEFIMGYKPSGDTFALETGVFYDFCKKAEADEDKPYFFIIDEINRGNLSKIFGELLMLIEADYRGTEAKLAYNKMMFSVPANLYLIGMMNTADRSLALIDYALRRRFSFFPVEPGFNSDGFGRYQEAFGNEVFDTLIERIRDLNMEITKDSALGSGFCIGHSYFCGQSEITEEWVQSVVEYDILPILEEYWFDDAVRLQKWQNILRGVFND